MKRLMLGMTLAAFGAVFAVGCDQESSVKKEKTITTPEGKTKVTEETKVEKSGDNPPPANK